MRVVRDIAGRPLVASALCSLFVWPAWFLGDEAARAFRRLIDHIVSRSDFLFALTTHDAVTNAIRSGQAWGAWIVYGLVTGLAAMLATRWLAGRPLPWVCVGLVLAAWLGVRVFVWNWEGMLQFAMTRVQLGGAPAVYGPWPYAGSIGFLGGLAGGLVVAATPWRAKRGTQDRPADGLAKKTGLS